MLTTLSRRSASASRRASSRSVLAANPAASFVLRGSTTQRRAPVGAIWSTKLHVGPVASTAIAVAALQRAMKSATPLSERGNRASHTRTPLLVMAHACKNCLCRSTPIYSRSMGCPPLVARSMRDLEPAHYLRPLERATALSSDQIAFSLAGDL